MKAIASTLPRRGYILVTIGATTSMVKIKQADIPAKALAPLHKIGTGKYANTEEIPEQTTSDKGKTGSAWNLGPPAMHQQTRPAPPVGMPRPKPAPKTKSWWADQNVEHPDYVSDEEFLKHSRVQKATWE